MWFGRNGHVDGLPFFLASLVFTGVLLAGGCDNTIEPFSERGSYSVYGVLFTDRDDQFIRVAPLNTPIPKVDSGGLQDATVTLENVTNGRSEVLRDSIMLFEDAGAEIVTHNFWTDTPIQRDTKYRLTVDGPGGSVVSTTVTPTARDARVVPSKAGCLDEYTTFYEEVDDLRRIKARIELKIKKRFLPEDFPRTQLVDRNWFFTSLEVFRGESGKTVSLFTPGFVLLRQPFGRPPLPDTLNPFCWMSNPCAALATDKFRVRYTYLGSEWYGDIPEDSLTYDPLTSFDVSGGLGFFGSARRDRTAARVDTSRFIFTGGIFCDQNPPDA